MLRAHVPRVICTRTRVLYARLVLANHLDMILARCGDRSEIHRRLKTNVCRVRVYCYRSNTLISAMESMSNGTGTAPEDWLVSPLCDAPFCP